MNRETWKNMKAGIAGLATGICLMSFITLNNTNETDTTKTTETDKTKTTETNKTKTTGNDTTKTTETDKTKTTETDKTKTTETDKIKILGPDTTTPESWVPWVQGVTIVSAGIGVGFWVAYLGQEIEERRRHQLLSQSDRRIIKMLSQKEKLDPSLKSTLENQLNNNLEKESELLYGNLTPHRFNDSPSQLQQSMDTKFASVEESLNNLNTSIESIKESNSDMKSILQEMLTKVTRSQTINGNEQESKA